jgi:hypothetical protein
MHFWGDIILHHPELIPELPPDVVALDWGYEWNDPYDEQARAFAESGIAFYVCPGTSSWNSLSGRTKNCLGNLLNAAENGYKHGAAGFLITDWGDNGHWQYLPISYVGLAGGGAASWGLEANRDLLENRAELCRALDAHVFHDDAGVMGGLAYDLGNTYLEANPANRNMTVFFSVLNRMSLSELDWQTVPLRGFEGLTQQNFLSAQEHVSRVTASLSGASMRRADADLVRDEFANAGRMLMHACSRALRTMGEGSPEGTADLADDMRAIIAEHRRLWLARNRPGGLQDSVARMQKRLDEYAG